MHTYYTVVPVGHLYTCLSRHRKFGVKGTDSDVQTFVVDKVHRSYHCQPGTSEILHNTLYIVVITLCRHVLACLPG